MSIINTITQNKRCYIPNFETDGSFKEDLMSEVDLQTIEFDPNEFDPSKMVGKVLESHQFGDYILRLHEYYLYQDKSFKETFVLTVKCSTNKSMSLQQIEMSKIAENFAIKKEFKLDTRLSIPFYKAIVYLRRLKSS